MSAALPSCSLNSRTGIVFSSASVIHGGSSSSSGRCSAVAPLCHLLPLQLSAQRYVSGTSGLSFFSSSCAGRKHTGASKRPRRGGLDICAERGTFEKVVEFGFKAGKDVVESAAELVPSTVPKPIAKGGIVVVGGLIVWSVLSSILSTFFSLVVVAGVAYLAFQYWSTNGGGGRSAKSSATKAEDPLDEARRIMDKYK